MLNQLLDMRRLGFNGSERTAEVPTVAVTFQNACMVFRPAYVYGRESSFGYIVPKSKSSSTFLTALDESDFKFERIN